MDKIMKGLIGIVGAVIGMIFITIIERFGLLPISGGWKFYVAFFANGFIFGLIFFVLSPKIVKNFNKLLDKIVKDIQRFSLLDIALSTLGLIIGLVIAYLITIPIYRIPLPYLSNTLPIFIYLVLGYLGIIIPYKNREELSSGITKNKFKVKSKKDISSSYKILDTSVIIDGRIADITKTGFLEGPLVIPKFVLDELQKIADSSDDLKRARGRRGLDILNEIQKDPKIEVIISEKDYEDIKEVDSKLLKLTIDLSGKVLTTDYNLNKVAEVQGISVLNINDLANAVKPLVIPGERMTIDVVKDGKESNQGLAYLDDGTMIVVEDGKKYIGKRINAVVTSVLQTSAGRMIFVKVD